MRPHTRKHCVDVGASCPKCPKCPECHPSAPPTPSSSLSSSSSSSFPFSSLPPEILVTICKFMSFKKTSQLRLVSRRFNEICASILNGTFQKLQNHMLQRFHDIRSKMPRRESARRNHPLAYESDIIETVHMRLSLLQMTFGKHIERKHLCFFPGDILDEVYRILRNVRSNPNLKRAYNVTDELFDLSSMAMEYFKENIEPTLPEIVYFGIDFLDFTMPSMAPMGKKQSRGLEASSSSRASVAGSLCSEPWSTIDDSRSVPESSLPPSNMVLRKRIRRIRLGMRRYNDQLLEVKRELKATKSKMEAQTKTVQDYSQRLEQYDQKFEESSRKFQTLITELNKCKTELQYWRSKSSILSAAAATTTNDSTCSRCDTSIGGGQEEGETETGVDGGNDTTEGKGATPPVAAALPPVSIEGGVRKRRSRDDNPQLDYYYYISNETGSKKTGSSSSTSRMSSAGVKNGASTNCTATTRSATTKRPKLC